MQSTINKVFIIFAVFVVKTGVCDSNRAFILPGDPTTQENIDLCKTPLFSTYRQTYVQYREIIFHGCEARPIVAFVLFENSTVEIFDGTFENGVKLPIRVLKSIRATGSIMSIRGKFGTADQVVVGDRFTKSGIDCGEVILNTPDDTIGVAMWIAPGCAYVFAGESVQLKMSPNVSLYQGYNLLYNASILQSQPITTTSNIFTAYLRPNTAVTLYVDESYGNEPQTVSYCYTKACQQINVNQGTPVQPFYVAPFLGVISVVEMPVISDSHVTLELLQPLVENVGVVVVDNDNGSYTWPDPTNTTCAFDGSFIIKYISDGGNGLYARTSIAKAETPLCAYAPDPSPSPTTVNPTVTVKPTTNLAGSSLVPVTATTTDSSAMTTTKPASPSIFNPFIVISCLFVCLVQRID